MPHVNMLANTVMDAHESAHEKDRNTHADEVKEVLRDVKALRMSAPVFSGRLAVGVVLGGVLWAAATSALAQGLPQHMVAYMTGPGQTKCPNNWTEAAYAQGRLILGTTDGSKIQSLAGTPASNAQPPQHDHAFKMVTEAIPSQSREALPEGGYGSLPRAAGGQGTMTGSTQEWPTPLSFIQFLVCEQMATESPDSAPYGTVAFFNASTCPANWTALDQADGRFLLPALAGANPGYATKTVWDPLNPPTHTHTLEAPFYGALECCNFEIQPSGQQQQFAQPGKYTLSATSAPGGPVLPFVSLLACEKAAMGNSEGVPFGTSIFFGGQDCPNDWGVTIGANGRFVLGIGGNGTQGATFGSDPISPGETSVQHDHEFSGYISLPESGYPGQQGQGYGTASFVPGGELRDFPVSGTSSAVTSDLPYLVMQSCTYTAGQSTLPGRR